MKIAVCIEKSGGMLFNNRRVSKDSILQQKLLECVGEGKILLNEYSAKQFTTTEHLQVSDDFLTIASDEDMGEVVEITNIENVVVEDIEKEDEIFQVVEAMPEFPGGTAELMKWLQKNIKYPSIAAENGVQGRVIVQFVVNKDGSIVDPVVLRSVDPYLDKEAIRVVKSMPKWKPGEQRGKPVRVKFTLPVMFRLT